MEEMNYEIMQMIDELQRMRYHQKAIGFEEAKTDRYGYAFEPLDTFSTEPLGFTETAMRLQTEAAELFHMICKVSRFSPLFIRMSGQFEKMVNQLGSCCITKAVMEQQGDTFDLLEMLTIDKLRGWAALNFRKSYAAFMDSHASGRYKPAAFDLSVRWAALDRRLLATAETIEKLRSGEIKADLSETSPAAEPKQAASENKETPAADTSFLPKGSALPIDKAAVREAEKQRAAEVHGSMDDPVPAVVSETGETPESVIMDAIPDGTDEYLPETEDRQEAFMRDVLLADAVGRADREAYETAVRARGADLESLWEQFLKRDAEDDFDCLRRLGLVMEEAEPPPKEEMLCTMGWEIN